MKDDHLIALIPSNQPLYLDPFSKAFHRTILIHLTHRHQRQLHPLVHHRALRRHHLRLLACLFRSPSHLAAQYAQNIPSWPYNQRKGKLQRPKSIHEIPLFRSRIQRYPTHAYTSLPKSKSPQLSDLLAGGGEPVLCVWWDGGPIAPGRGSGKRQVQGRGGSKGGG